MDRSNLRHSDRAFFIFARWFARAPSEQSSEMVFESSPLILIPRGIVVPRTVIVTDEESPDEAAARAPEPCLIPQGLDNGPVAGGTQPAPGLHFDLLE